MVNVSFYFKCERTIPWKTVQLTQFAVAAQPDDEANWMRPQVETVEMCFTWAF